MADGLAAAQPHRECRAICLPIMDERHVAIVNQPRAFRRWVEELAQEVPELFPEGVCEGFQFKDHRLAKKLNL